MHSPQQVFKGSTGLEGQPGTRNRRKPANDGWFIARELSQPGMLRFREQF
jgi:hypothetical protein